MRNEIDRLGQLMAQGRLSRREFLGRAAALGVSTALATTLAGRALADTPVKGGVLKANPNGGFIEIEGHTDNVGEKNLNYKLGLDRAEAVKRYLYENQQIPLHKINVISYGEEKPIAPNKTKDGRAQNRRVVIKVLT